MVSLMIYNTTVRTRNGAHSSPKIVIRQEVHPPHTTEEVLKHNAVVPVSRPSQFKTKTAVTPAVAHMCPMPKHALDALSCMIDAASFALLSSVAGEVCLTARHPGQARQTWHHLGDEMADMWIRLCAPPPAIGDIGRCISWLFFPLSRQCEVWYFCSVSGMRF